MLDDIRDLLLVFLDLIKTLRACRKMSVLKRGILNNLKLKFMMNLLSKSSCSGKIYMCVYVLFIYSSCVCIYRYMCICVYICMCTCIYVWMYCMFMCVYMYLCTVCVCIYVYVHLDACVRVCIY